MPSLPVLARQIAQALWQGVTDPGLPASRKWLIVGGFTASGLRLAAGTSIVRLGPRPALPMRLWEFERCPYSRMVREALSSLDLDAEVRPCPVGGARFRPELAGGAVPRLEDPNAPATLTGAREIVAHLHERYGTGRPPRFVNLPPVRLATGGAVRVLTGQRGAVARPSRAPAVPLELWSFESSPYCRMVRAVLSELELPYLLHNLAKGSRRRRAFVEMSGKMQVPYLYDPNTSARMFESLEIERYLESTYGEA